MSPSPPSLWEGVGVETNGFPTGVGMGGRLSPKPNARVVSICQQYKVKLGQRNMFYFDSEKKIKLKH